MRCAAEFRTLPQIATQHAPGRFAGSPRAIYRSAANRFVANFIGETNLFAGTLTKLQGHEGRVQTELGEFRAQITAGVAKVGDHVSCMVRPECMLIKHSDLENSFHATMKRTVYLGEFEQLELEAGGETLQVLRANPDGAAPPSGATMQVVFSANDAVILIA